MRYALAILVVIATAPWLIGVVLIITHTSTVNPDRAFNVIATATGIVALIVGYAAYLEQRKVNEPVKETAFKELDFRLNRSA